MRRASLVQRDVKTIGIATLIPLKYTRSMTTQSYRKMSRLSITNTPTYGQSASKRECFVACVERVNFFLVRTKRPNSRERPISRLESMELNRPRHVSLVEQLFVDSVSRCTGAIPRRSPFPNRNCPERFSRRISS